MDLSQSRRLWSIPVQCLTSCSLSAKFSLAEPRQTTNDGKIGLVCVQLVIFCLSWPNGGNICWISCRPSWRTQMSCSMIPVLQVSICRCSYQQRLSSHKDILVGTKPCWCFLNVSKARAGKPLHSGLSKAAQDVVFFFIISFYGGISNEALSVRSVLWYHPENHLSKKRSLSVEQLQVRNDLLRVK